MNTETSQRGLVVSQIFAGIGIGLLVGIIVGLSVSPVVKTILGSLAGLLAAFLGLQDSLFAKQEEEDLSKVSSRMKMSSIRAGSFGLSCVLGILVGVVLRTHDALTISVKEQVNRWVEAGYDTAFARDLVVYQRLRITPDSAGFAVDPEFASTTIDAAAGFLFTKKEMKNYCVSLNLSTRYDNNVQNALESYDGMTPEIQAFAASVRKVPDPQQAKIINSVVSLICFLGNSDLNLEEFCRELKGDVNFSNIQQSLEDLTSSDIYELAVLASDILRAVPDEQVKGALVKSILEVICPTKS